jgi:hypothetical protein
VHDIQILLSPAHEVENQVQAGEQNQKSLAEIEKSYRPYSSDNRESPLLSEEFF